jgi:hypothetical protein
MKRLLLALCVFNNALSAHEDLGVHGELYEIREENIKSFIQRRVAEIDKSEIKRSYENALEKAFIAAYDLPVSKVDSSETYKDRVVAQADVYAPNDPDRIIYRKGESVVSRLPDGVVLKMCFVDAKNEAIAQKVIQEFGECDYLIANRDIRKMPYLEKNRVFPMSEPYLRRFKIQKLPVKLTMQSDTITKEHLSIVRIIEELKEGN